MRLFILMVCAALLGMSDNAGAGTRQYDMSAMLAEPHPFAANGYGASAPAAQPAPQGPQTYEERVDAWVKGRGSNLGRLTGITRAPQPGEADAATAQAETPALPRRIRPDESRLQAAIGYYDINDTFDAAEVRLEWHGKKMFWHVRPLAGIMATSDKAFYGYAGIILDMFFGDHIVVSPSFAPGLYSDGDGKDLGHTIEFRSALEIAWRFDGGSRLGLTLYHLSNASLGDSNPGTEVLSLGYTLPLSSVWSPSKDGWF